MARTPLVTTAAPLIVGCLLFQAVFPVTVVASIRGRRLRATPYGPAPTPSNPSATTFPPKFVNKGGSPDIAGVWHSDTYVGIVRPSGFVSTIYQPDDANTWMVQMGRWLSYECTGVADGQYIAATLRRDTYSNGTIVTKRRCEVGQIWFEDNGRGKYGWNSSDLVCPDPKTVQFNLPNYRVPNDSIHSRLSYTCRKGGPSKAVDTFGVGGLELEGSVDDAAASASELPPPLDTNANFPPVFANKGAPAEISGAWLAAPGGGDAAISIELVDQTGFSNIQELADGRFASVLGRFDSYNCSGPGEYIAALSFYIAQQNATSASAAACTAGKVDLKAEQYSWITSNSQTCPGLTNDGDTKMVRAFSSNALPSATSLTCK
jgi:hypothetical protein